MSRIGNAPIEVPQGVEVQVEKGLVTVKGPKGELTQDIDTAITVEVDGNVINVKRHTEQKDHKAKHGLYIFS
jgi:large subunit ribosomal protein L6